MPVAVPSIEQELHTGFAQVQIAATGYTLAYAVLTLENVPHAKTFTLTILLIILFSGKTILMVNLIS